LHGGAQHGTTQTSPVPHVLSPQLATSVGESAGTSVGTSVAVSALESVPVVSGAPVSPQYIVVHSSRPSARHEHELQSHLHPF